MPTIGEKITAAMANITKLEIKTMVTVPGAEKKMITTIDLVDGDISNAMDLEFVTGDLRELRAFHEQQVLKGQQIIKDNIAALKALWELVKEAGVKDNAAPPPKS